nr:hypothetical protein CFP56_78168 [Quercus suber]
MGSPQKVTANPSPLSQYKVNFVENILYDESAPTGEYPIVRIPGGSHLKDPRGLLSQKKMKPRGKAEFYLRRHAGPECSLQKDLGPPSYMIAQEEILEELGDTMIQNIPSPGSRGAPIPEE